MRRDVRTLVGTLFGAMPGTGPTITMFIAQGIQPGPQLITDHADIFRGLIASFWIGNILLVILNVPMIGVPAAAE